MFLDFIDIYFVHLDGPFEFEPNGQIEEEGEERDEEEGQMGGEFGGGGDGGKRTYDGAVPLDGNVTPEESKW